MTENLHKDWSKIENPWNENHVWSIKRWSNNQKTSQLLITSIIYIHLSQHIGTPPNGNWWLAAFPQDDVAARARARELAVSRVNRARAQLGAGDALKAEQEIPRKFFPGVISDDFLDTFCWWKDLGRINRTMFFWFFGIEVPTQIFVENSLDSDNFMSSWSMNLFDSIEFVYVISWFGKVLQDVAICKNDQKVPNMQRCHFVGCTTSIEPGGSLSLLIGESVVCWGRRLMVLSKELWGI